MSNFYNSDHPMFQVLFRSESFDHDVASATDGAVIRSRNPIVVRAVNIETISVGSADEQLSVIRTAGGVAATIATLTPGTTISVGSLPGTAPSTFCITLASSNTLHSMGDYIAIRHVNAGGQYRIHYEYMVLPGASLVGNGPN